MIIDILIQLSKFACACSWPKNDAIVKNLNVLLLSETRMENEEPLNIPNFSFVVIYKRPKVPAAAAAIYHNTQDTHFITSPMGIHNK